MSARNQKLLKQKKFLAVLIGLLAVSLLLAACSDPTTATSPARGPILALPPVATPVLDVPTTVATAPTSSPVAEATTLPPATPTPELVPISVPLPAPTATATTTPAPATQPVPTVVSPNLEDPAYKPIIWFSASTLKTGDTLVVSGSGFPAETRLNVALGIGGKAPDGSYASPYTDPRGTFSTRIKFDFNHNSKPLPGGKIVVAVSTADQAVAAGAAVTLSDPLPSPTTAPVPAITAGPEQPQPGKWIEVNLSKQRLTAYEGNKAVFTTLVSSGLARFPTVTGTYNVYLKYLKQDMRGGEGADAYLVKNVPYVMYFYAGYGIHGAYWHNNFGQRMSHGCVNTPVEASRFLYNWAPIGTTVTVHY